MLSVCDLSSFSAQLQMKPVTVTKHRFSGEVLFTLPYSAGEGSPSQSQVFFFRLPACGIGVVWSRLTRSRQSRFPLMNSQVNGQLKTSVRLQRANGFRMLEMFADAESELSSIPLEDLMQKEVLAMKVAVRQDSSDWKGMQKPARILRELFPDEADWWIADAYATRRSESIESARELLLEGEKLHAENACIKYNLACYACRSGDPDKALQLLLAARSIESKYLKMALEDEDLAEIRDALLSIA